MTSDSALECFSRGSMVIILQIALVMLQHLEQFNKALQSRLNTACGMLKAAETVVQGLHNLRNTSHFEEILNKSFCEINKYDLEPLTLPRKRHPPARLLGDASATFPETAIIT